MWSQEKNLIRSMWICDGLGKGHHFSIFPQSDLVRNVLGTILEKVNLREKPYQEYVDLWWSWQGSPFLQLFPTWFGKGLSWGAFWKKWIQEKYLIRNMWVCNGPGKDHHFSNCSQHGLGRDCLGDHFGKSEAKRKTLSGVCGFVMVLARVIIFQIFPNMIW